MDNGRVRSGVFGPLLLIGFGMLLLLNNMNVISVSVWMMLFRLWPLFLIASGLDMLIGRRSVLGAVTSVILILGLFAGGIWLIQTQEPVRKTTRTVFTEPLSGTKSASVRIDPGVAEISIESISGDQLIDFRVPVINSGWLDYDLHKTGNAATIKLSLDPDMWLPDFNFDQEDWLWQVGLNQSVSYNLTVDMGVGVVAADLSDMQVEQIQIDLGVGEVDLILPNEGKVDVHVDSGIGQLIISIPENMSARIIMDTGLVGHKLPARYTQSGDVYYSTDYSDTANSVDIYIEQGMGAVIIRHPGAH